ncbi:MAG: hypothetical protein LH609_13510 [Rudanella sp.]|nr:hypothetical protein [Rudanella sp.]
MFRSKTLLLLGCCLFSLIASAQDINLNGNPATSVGIDGQFTNPILTGPPVRPNAYIPEVRLGRLRPYGPDRRSPNLRTGSGRHG